MMDIDFLRLHQTILGGSYVGLEFAQIYCRFGSEVTVIKFAPRLIPREDEDVSKAVLDILKDEGVNVQVDSKVVGLQREGNAIVVNVESAGKMSPTAGSQQHGDGVPVTNRWNAFAGADRSAAEHE
jgi:pyruvate/2-oxoglutarate dehydrogenase complex dihydrolipoamide dehydrogenase (E3) component